MTSLDKFKLQAVTWDSDAHPDATTFQRWAEDFWSVVRATDGGSPLEDLNDKVGRQVLQPIAVPSYLKDGPDFAGYFHQPTSVPADAESVDFDGYREPQGDVATVIPTIVLSTTGSAAQSRGSAFSLSRSRVAYQDLDEKTRALDQMIYNIPRFNVKGIKCELLSSVLFVRARNDRAVQAYGDQSQ